MQFGIAVPNFSRLGTRDTVVEIVREAESLGYDSIWTTDHVMMQKGQEEPYGHILEALTTLSYLAALTERVRLGTSVIVFPQRNPVLVAKEAATLDYLSGGRLMLGVGAGWNEREFDSLGASFEDRGRRLNEYIAVLRELWTSDSPSFQGSYVRFSDALFSPRPIQPNGPPILIGGSTPAAIRRAALLADGWHPVGASPERFAAGMSRIRELSGGRAVEGSLRIRTAVGRSLPDSRGNDGQPQVTLSGSVEEIVGKVKDYAASGVSHLVSFFPAEEKEPMLDQMRRFAKEIKSAFP